MVLGTALLRGEAGGGIGGGTGGAIGKSSSRLKCVGRVCMTESSVGGASRLGDGLGRIDGIGRTPGGGVWIDSRRVDMADG